MKFLIVDDHPVFRKALKDLVSDLFPDSEFAEAGEEDQAIAVLEHFLPDLILADLDLNNNYDFSLIKKFKAIYNEVPILVVSMYCDTQAINTSLKVGASGYVTKQDTPDHIERAIKTLMNNEQYLSEKASSAMVLSLQESSPEGDLVVEDMLSPREYEVFTLIGKGRSRHEIADLLNISVPTVETHIQRTKTKLNLDSGQKLSYFAYEHNSKRGK